MIGVEVEKREEVDFNRVERADRVESAICDL